MSMIKTTEEFSSRRKVRYGGGDASSVKGYPLTSSSVNASLSPHKATYGRDADGSEAYFIEFNIGDFNFDEVSIRTEGRRLIVQGKSKHESGKEELSREFTRDFTLPNNVDQYTIKAQLDEHTRQLTLIGKVKEAVTQTTTSTTVSSSSASSFSDWGSAKLGTVRESRNARTQDYEIYLGNDLKDGQVSIEISGYNALVIRVTKNDWDRNGDFSLELKRTIKLPFGVNPQNIEHGIDSRAGSLFVKVPLK